MSKVNQYFAEFVNPCICNGMGDLFEFELLPPLKGLYREDYSKHCGYDSKKFTKLITLLRTAVKKGDGTLDKETTSHDDLFDSFRLSLQFWHSQQQKVVKS